MPTLLDCQRAVRRAILVGDPTEADPFIVANAFLPAERLNVYRNTFIGTLTTALRLSYPAVHKLVGNAFFESAAAHFIDEHPPTSAYLNDYGAAFPEFLKLFTPATSLTYLPDVARLEWAVNGAIHALDSPGLNLEDLATVGADDLHRLRFVAKPSVSLVNCNYPVDLIWRAVLSEDDAALSRIDLGAGKVWLIIERTDHGAEVVRMSEAAWRFTSDIFAGSTLQEALDVHANSYEPDFLAIHLTAGRFTRFDVCSTVTPANLDGEVS